MIMVVTCKCCKILTLERGIVTDAKLLACKISFSMGIVLCLNFALKFMSDQQLISRPKIEASSFLPNFQWMAVRIVSFPSCHLNIKTTVLTQYNTCN